MSIQPITPYPNFIHNKPLPKFETKARESQSDNNAITYAAIGGAVVAGIGAVFAGYNILKKGKPPAIDEKVEPSAIVKDFIQLCKTAKPEDYCASVQNIKTGTFTKDLHSHSTYSDGYGIVGNILNQVCNYANELFQKTGKKFTFALTDHDRVGGAKKALEIINENPEKFKNVNFVPGVELSFSFISNGKVKSGELLTYFIKPESKAMQILVEDLNKNRNKMIDDCIKNLGDGFSRHEMENYFINKDGETFAYNLHYRLRNYAQIKNRVNNIAKEQNCDSHALYEKLMNEYVFYPGGRVGKPFVSPEGFNEYLKRKQIETNTPIIDDRVNDICNEFFPKIVDGKIVSNTENSFEKIIDTLKDENDVVLGFAHPYFLAEQMTNFKSEFDKLLSMSKNKIKFTESYHQAYDDKLPKDVINSINEFLESRGLIPIGGRDNHRGSFL